LINKKGEVVKKETRNTRIPPEVGQPIRWNDKVYEIDVIGHCMSESDTWYALTLEVIAIEKSDQLTVPYRVNNQVLNERQLNKDNKEEAVLKTPPWLKVRPRR